MSVTETTKNEILQKELTLNMGPQHPSTHGVLRLVVDLQGETVVNIDPRIGYLHRGIEKWMESKTYHQIIPMTDRLEYISSMNNNLGYAVAVEKLAGISVPERAQFIRTLIAELSRLSAHLIWFGTHALDIGSMTAPVYAFRERELILDLLEIATGARMTVSYARIGGVRNDLPRDFIDKCYEFTELFPKRIDEYDTLIKVNRIWLKRTQGIGVISPEDAINYGMTGASLRGSGVNYDLRKVEPYAAYDKVEFDVPLGTNGDVYDRYLVRIAEMRQSARIVEQVLASMPSGAHIADAPKVTLPPRNTLHTSMEALIHHFLIICNGVQPPPGEAYVPTESSKGELGFYMVSDGSARPYRVRMRPPSFKNLQVLPKLAEGLMVADLIAVIGSIDIVLGEIDR